MEVFQFLFMFYALWVILCCRRRSESQQLIVKQSLFVYYSSVLRQKAKKRKKAKKKDVYFQSKIQGNLEILCKSPNLIQNLFKLHKLPLMLLLSLLLSCSCTSCMTQTPTLFSKDIKNQMTCLNSVTLKSLLNLELMNCYIL